MITGMMTEFPVADDAPEFKGVVVIEHPSGSAKNSILPGCLTRVLDEQGLIPASSITLKIPSHGIITADIGVFLDKHGGIIRDPSAIWRDSDGVPAVFPFKVAAIRGTTTMKTAFQEVCVLRHGTGQRCQHDRPAFHCAAWPVQRHVLERVRDERVRWDQHGCHHVERPPVPFDPHEFLHVRVVQGRDVLRG